VHAASESVTSAFKPPDPKKQLSARVRSSIFMKLSAIMRIWQAKAEADGVESDEIDQTFVVDALLAKATDEELQQWGGLPTSEASWKEVLRAIKDVSKKQ
jgi:hypothetical protein